MTEPFALVESSALGMLVSAKLDEVALASVVLPVKVLVLEKVFAVVVEKAVVKTPVAAVYESGKDAERLELEILLLKVVQSVLASLPLASEEANGRLKVMTLEAAEMVKSVPVVELASVWVPPVCV